MHVCLHLHYRSPSDGPGNTLQFVSLLMAGVECMQCICTIHIHMEQAGPTIILSPPLIMVTPSQNSKILIDYLASIGQVDVMGPQLGCRISRDR